MQAQRDKEQRLIDTRRAVQTRDSAFCRQGQTLSHRDQGAGELPESALPAAPLQRSDDRQGRMAPHPRTERHPHRFQDQSSPPAPDGEKKPPVRTASLANRPVSPRRILPRARAYPISATAGGPATAPTGLCQGRRSRAAIRRVDKTTESRRSPDRAPDNGQNQNQLPGTQTNPNGQLAQGVPGQQTFPGQQCFPGNRPFRYRRERRCPASSKACPDARPTRRTRNARNAGHGEQPVGCHAGRFLDVPGNSFVGGGSSFVGGG